MEENQWIRESLTVKGRLKCHISFWRQIGAPEFIIDTIRHGYKIAFYTTPPSNYFPNNRSAKQNEKFVH